MIRESRVFVGIIIALVAFALFSCTKSSRYRSARMTDSPLIPISEADRPYAGKVTYYLAKLDQNEDGSVYLDADIFNGVARSFSQFSVIVTLLGKDGEQKRFRQPMGPLNEGVTERLVLSIRKIKFKVERIQIAVQLFGSG